MTAKLNHVNSRRATPGKPDPICQRCRKPIEAGTGYVWFKFRNQARKTYHATPACRPTAADRESNEKRAAHMRASEHVSDAKADGIDPATSAGSLRDAITEVESIVDSLNETLDAWSGTNFEFGEMAQSFETSRDALDEWKSNAETWADALEELTAVDEPGDEPEEPIEPRRDEFEDGDKGTADYEAAYDEYLDEQNEYEAAFAQWQHDVDEYETYQNRLTEVIDEIEDVPELEF